jgi:DNA-binding ferritin-like protein (Dps family)
MFNGVKKIRVEIIKLNDEEDDVEKNYRDVDYKKDVLGKSFSEYYKEINETLTTMSVIQEKKELKSKKNILDDF